MTPPPALRSAAAGYPCGLVTADAGGRILEVNAALCQMVGQPEAALVGQPAENLFSRAGRAMFQSYLLPLLRLHGRVEEFVITVHVPGGPPHDVLVYATQERPAEGGLLRLVLAPYRTRRAVDEELLRVRRAADQSPGMIFHFRVGSDGSASFPYASEAVRELYGCSPADARQAAAAVLDRLHPDDRALFFEPAGDGFVEGLRHFLVRLPQAGGPTAWHEVHATARRERDGTLLWHGHIADVTDRRRMEEESASRHAAELARQAHTEFLGRLSHELRTPLNAILGFAQLLAEREAGNLSPLQQRQIGMIGTAGEQLLHLVDEVLDITRLQNRSFKVSLTRTDVRATLDRCLALAGPQAAAAGVTLLPLPDGPGPALAVLADERRLEQVLGNLLSNAVKYNVRGGRVWLQADMQGSMARLSVCDSGLGLSEAQRRALFQPFNRLGAEASPVPGTGLGLVITRQLVEQMGGVLEVESERGRGSSFHVLLPRAVAPATGTGTGTGTGTQRPEAPSAAPVAKRVRVLYVEDNDVNALVMEAILARRPQVELHVVPTGAAAVSAALAHPPALLLIDKHLPDTTGHAVLRQLRAFAALQSVPAIMVSAEATPESRRQARLDGFCDYWTKPLNVAHTLEALDTVLREATAP